MFRCHKQIFILCFPGWRYDQRGIQSKEINCPQQRTEELHLALLDFVSTAHPGNEGALLTIQVIGATVD